MKVFKLLATVATAAAAFSSQNAWAADNATADATVTLVSAINVSKTSDLAFGTIAVPSSGSKTKTIDLAGTRDSGSSAVDIGTQTISAGAFAVTGYGGVAYTPTVTVTDLGVTGLELSAITAQCDSVTAESLTIGAAKGLSSCVLAAGGTSTVKVAGTLTISSTASPGIGLKPGKIDITVAYN